MTNYTPTVADYKFLVEHYPERFVSPVDARRTLDQIGRDHIGDEHRLAAVQRNYELGGHPPLEQSPIPPTADANGDGTLDPEFAAICVDCQPNEPCCMKSGSVTDGADSSRKLLWPPVNSETKMFTVAKEMENNLLVSKLKVAWQGKNCVVGHPDRPRIATRGLAERVSSISAKSADVSVGYDQGINTVLLLKDYVPENVIYALFVFDIIMALQSAQSGPAKATFTPSQCISDEPTAAGLEVIAFPYAKLDGELQLATSITFSTGGVSGSAEAKGSLEGQYGSYTFKAEGKTGGASSTGQAVDSGETPSGLVGTMASIIGTMDRFVAIGNTQTNRKLDSTAFGSSITLSKSLTFKPRGFELKGKSNSPDLEVVIGTLDSALSVGITGRLDFIDALAMAFTGPGAAAIREARARMASGEHITGKLEAYLELSATGTLTHSINSGATITIPANGPMERALAGVSQQFGGKFEIRGVAKIAIEIEAKVWIFEAKAGASGTVHTSWTWEMRMHEGQRQKRYIFEGVIATAQAYASVDIASDQDGVGQNIFSSTASAEASGNVGDLFQKVENAISSSQRSAAEMARNRLNNPAAGGDSYTLLRPESTEWEDY